MPKIRIDNKTYEVKDGQNLLHVALSLGLDIPYFCWHPSLGSVGACRQCAVQQFKDEKDTQGRIVMSCMTPASEGTCISIDHPEAKQFRASVIEWLMTNHPHDCPICDEGGECHLQDMTVMTGHNYRRYRFKKRTFKNQYLGPFINHEMNRCITCYRCVRFYKDYAGGTDLNAFASSNRVYFGRHEDGVLENEFSGNLVEVCPTGVFTDKSFKKHYTRKWDLQTAPSLCHSCGLGCNIIPGERYGELRRIVNRYNYDVNGYFICDRGRFGYEYVNDKQRVQHPMVSEAVATSDKALEKMKSFLSQEKNIIGIGSPRATLESNYALRTMVGEANFFSGMSAVENNLVKKVADILLKGPTSTPSIKEVEEADAVVVLGEDLTNTGARLALAIRQAVKQQPIEEAMKMGIARWNEAALKNAIQQDKGPLFLATTSQTKLEEVSREAFHGSPDEIARFGYGLAQKLGDSNQPAVEGLSSKEQGLIKEIVESLKKAKRPVIIAGTSLSSEAVIEAAANIAWALTQAGQNARLCYVVPEVNSMGLGLLKGKNLDEAFQLAKQGKVDTAIILENDLFRRAHTDDVNQFFGHVKNAVVLDSLQNATTAKANVTLPAATFAEGAGTVISNEGRAQRFYRVFAPKNEIQESWKWLRDSMKTTWNSKAASWENLDAICDALSEEIALLKPLKEQMPKAKFRVAGQKLARETQAYSGRTAMTANVSVVEPKPPVDNDSPFSHSMEGFIGPRPADLQAFYWQPGWNSVQSTAKYQTEVGGHMRGGDAGYRLFPSQGSSTGGSGQGVQFFPNRISKIDSESLKKNFESKGECLVVPFYHLFGSEEMSVHSTSLSERIPAPYVAMNDDDVKSLNLRETKIIKLSLNGMKYRLPVVIHKGLPKGVIGFPVGLPDSCWVNLPCKGEIVRESV